VVLQPDITAIPPGGSPAPPALNISGRSHEFTVGSTGDSPVPSGDPPDGMGSGIDRKGTVVLQPDITAIPPGGSKSGPLRLKITDDGKGFSLDRLPAEGLGLRIMRFRAECIGAVFWIESSLKQGTTVQCCLAATK